MTNSNVSQKKTDDVLSVLVASVSYDNLVSSEGQNIIDRNKASIERLLSSEYLTKEQTADLFKSLHETIKMIKSIIQGHHKNEKYYFGGDYDLPFDTFVVLVRSLQQHPDAVSLSHITELLEDITSGLHEVSLYAKKLKHIPLSQRINESVQQHTHDSLLLCIASIFLSVCLQHKVYFNEILSHLQTATKIYPDITGEILSVYSKAIYEVKFDHYSLQEWTALLNGVLELGQIGRIMIFERLLHDVLMSLDNTEHGVIKFLFNNIQKLYQDIIQTLSCPDTDESIIYDNTRILVLLSLLACWGHQHGHIDVKTQRMLHNMIMEHFDKMLDNGGYRIVREILLPAVALYTADIANIGGVFLSLCQRKILVHKKNKYLSRSVVDIIFNPEKVFCESITELLATPPIKECINKYKQAIKERIVHDETIKKYLYQRHKRFIDVLARTA